MLCDKHFKALFCLRCEQPKDACKRTCGGSRQKPFCFFPGCNKGSSCQDHIVCKSCRNSGGSGGPNEMIKLGGKWHVVNDDQSIALKQEPTFDGCPQQMKLCNCCNLLRTKNPCDACSKRCRKCEKCDRWFDKYFFVPIGCIWHYECVIRYAYNLRRDVILLSFQRFIYPVLHRRMERGGGNFELQLRLRYDVSFTANDVIAIQSHPLSTILQSKCSTAYLFYSVCSLPPELFEMILSLI